MPAFNEILNLDALTRENDVNGGGALLHARSCRALLSMSTCTFFFFLLDCPRSVLAAPWCPFSFFVVLPTATLRARRNDVRLVGRIATNKTGMVGYEATNKGKKRQTCGRLGACTKNHAFCPF